MTKFKAGDRVSIRTIGEGLECLRKGRTDASFKAVNGRIITLNREYFALVTKEK